MNWKAVASGTAAIAALLSPSWACASTTVFGDNGSIAQVTETVTDFRSALGSLNSGAANFVGGRREINWDGVPDTASDPNPFPGNFFNTGSGGRARGLEVSTPGTGFLVSADSSNPTATAIAFGFASDFQAFSAERMFVPIGSNITDVRFFNPVTPSQRATTRAFGAVLEDVEDRGSQMSFFDASDNLLLVIDIPRGGSGEQSFAGVVFDSAVIGRVRILAGNAPLLANGIFGPGGNDGVVMDDFIYGEPVPVPEPATYAMMGVGLLAVAALARRRRMSS